MNAARFQSAGLRFPIALAFVIPVFALYLTAPRLTHTQETVVGALLSALVAWSLGWAAYAAYVRRIERRPLTELSLPGAGRELVGGIVLGVGLFATTIGTLALVGAYRVEGRHDVAIAAIPLVSAIGTAFIEEILFLAASSIASSRARSGPGSR